MKILWSALLHRATIINKKLKPGLVACYDIWPGNRQGLVLFWCFINLLLTYLLTHFLTAPEPTRGVFQVNLDQLTPSSAIYPTCSGRTFGDVWHRFSDRMPSQSCNQQCHGTKGNCQSTEGHIRTDIYQSRAQLLITSRQQSTFVQPKMHAAAITWRCDDGV